MKDPNIKTFDDVKAFLSKIPAIHSGGCGISALAMARWLKSSDCVASASFVFGYDDLSSYTQNSKALVDYTQKPTSAVHVGIIVYDYEKKQQHIIDCKKVFEISNFRYATLCSESFLVESLNVLYDWNSIFDRRQWVPKISEALGVDLSDIDIRGKYEALQENSKFESYTREKHEPTLFDQIIEDSVSEEIVFDELPVI